MQRLLIALLIAISTAAAAQDSTIYTDSKSESTVVTDGTMTTTVISPPPSAISPNLTNGSGDICTTGVSGAVQTQILGISAGSTIRDVNCERLKLSKTLFDMGMKVAAVSLMCGDPRVFEAMMNAGTPCPIDGLIGDRARMAWEANPPSWTDQGAMTDSDKRKFTALGGIILLLGLLIGI